MVIHASVYVDLNLKNHYLLLGGEQLCISAELYGEMGAILFENPACIVLHRARRGSLMQEILEELLDTELMPLDSLAGEYFGLLILPVDCQGEFWFINGHSL
jgi:hypothetical protein